MSRHLIASRITKLHNDSNNDFKSLLEFSWVNWFVFAGRGLVEIVGDPKEVETGGFSLTVAASRVFCLLKDGGGPLVTGVWLAKTKRKIKDYQI